MRRHPIRLAAAALVITALACGENGVSPRRTVSQGAARAQLAHPIPGADAPESYTFDISTDGGTIALGDRFTLTFPANAVCDPSSSSYGLGHWDEDCTPTDRSITVHATIWSSNGQAYVDFSPALRFAPSAVVTISTTLVAPIIAGRTDLANTPAMLSRYAIQYSPDGKSQVNEVSLLGDASAITHVNLTTGVVWRRIKHFSGYVIVFSGEPCDPSLGDPDCIFDPNAVGGEQ